MSRWLTSLVVCTVNRGTLSSLVLRLRVVVESDDTGHLGGICCRYSNIETTVFPRVADWTVHFLFSPSTLFFLHGILRRLQMW